MSSDANDRYDDWIRALRDVDDSPDLAPGVMTAITATRRRLPGIAWAAAFLVLALRVFASFAYLLVF